MISIGFSTTLLFGILMYAPSLAKAVFKEVNVSSLLAILLKYSSITILYFGLLSADDIKQTSKPSCVVDDKNELNFPSTKMTLWVSISCMKYFFTSANSIAFSCFGNTE